MLALERFEGRGEVLLPDGLKLLVSDDTGGIKVCSLRLKRGILWLVTVCKVSKGGQSRFAVVGLLYLLARGFNQIVGTAAHSFSFIDTMAIIYML